MKKLTRDEMKRIKGGVDELTIAPSGSCTASCNYNWSDYQGKSHTTSGYCTSNTGSGGMCYCSNGVGSGCS